MSLFDPHLKNKTWFDNINNLLVGLYTLEMSLKKLKDMKAILVNEKKSH